MNTKTVYQLDEEGYLVGQTIAFESPLEPGIFHIPRGCIDTDKELPKLEHFDDRIKWSGTEWIVCNERIEKEKEEELKRQEEERLKLEEIQKIEDEKKRQEELERLDEKKRRQEEEKRTNDILNRKKELEEKLNQIQIKQIQYQQNNNEALVSPDPPLPKDSLTYLS